MIYLDWTWKLELAAKIFGNRKSIWVIYTSKKQNVTNVKCFVKVENWHVAEGTLYRFHSIHMTILFALSSVLITYIFGNSLIKTSFEAKDIRSNWTLKTMLFFLDFGLYVQAMSFCDVSTGFHKKLTGTDLGCSSDEGE